MTLILAKVKPDVAQRCKLCMIDHILDDIYNATECKADWIYSYRTIKIPSVEKNVSLDVWLYKPIGVGPHPVVVAGNCLTGIKEAGLAVFGERFATEAGYASLILDYRFFGDSGGEPRNLVVVEKQQEDYCSVIQWARERPDLFRKDQIVLMGTSLSALSVANLVLCDEFLAGGIVQCPVLDGYATTLALPIDPRLAFWIAIDFVRAKLGMSPIFIKATGHPGELAFLSSPDTYLGFNAIFAQGRVPFFEAPNILSPRIGVDIMLSRPGLELNRAKCPLLVIMPVDDDLVAPRITRDLAKKSNGKVKLVEISGGHFDVYRGGKGFETNIHAQLEFLRGLL